MKKLTRQARQEVRFWMHRNARELELSIWNCLFEGGTKEAVITALGFYQNEDGGFGNTLEPDSWNVESSPYATANAIGLLHQIGFTDISHPIYQGIIKYLESGKEVEDYGWRFSIPSNDQYPRAPWWTYSEEQNPIESIGLTAGLCGFILKYVNSDSELYRKAAALVPPLLSGLQADGDKGEMAFSGYLLLLLALKETGAVPCDTEAVGSHLFNLMKNAIEYDDSKWIYYTARPSKFIQSPESPIYADCREVMDKELDFLLDTRLDKGVWNINWSWFDLTEKYANEYAISENWSKAIVAINYMSLLKNFGRFEE